MTEPHVSREVQPAIVQGLQVMFCLCRNKHLLHGSEPFWLLISDARSLTVVNFGHRLDKCPCSLQNKHAFGLNDLAGRVFTAEIVLGIVKFETFEF